MGPEGFFQIHQSFVSAVHKIGLLTPPILDLSKMVIDKIILIGDSTFLKVVASTKGQKDTDGNRLFTDDSIASGKPHHKHKYPVGHRAHTLTARESDQNCKMPLLEMALDSYPSLPFACVILDAGYDAEELHRDIYTELNLLLIIIRKPSVQCRNTSLPLRLSNSPSRNRIQPWENQVCVLLHLPR